MLYEVGNAQLVLWRSRVQGLRLRFRMQGLFWVLPPLSNSWIIIIIWIYIALNRTPNVDCYWVGGSTQGLLLRIYCSRFRDVMGVHPLHPHKVILRHNELRTLKSEWRFQEPAGLSYKGLGSIP